MLSKGLLVVDLKLKPICDMGLDEARKFCGVEFVQVDVVFFQKLTDFPVNPKLNTFY